jgi:Protein of unknown function (DUF2384)
MAEKEFLAEIVGPLGYVEAERLTRTLRITRLELALAAGLSRDAVSKTTRMRAHATQARLRDVAEIVNRALPWCGSVHQAFAWYRAQPLPSFGDETAEDLVKEGRAEDVKRYLSRIAVGGYA